VHAAVTVNQLVAVHQVQQRERQLGVVGECASLFVRREAQRLSRLVLHRYVIEPRERELTCQAQGLPRDPVPSQRWRVVAAGPEKAVSIDGHPRRARLAAQRHPSKRLEGVGAERGNRRTSALEGHQHEAGSIVGVVGLRTDVAESRAADLLADRGHLGAVSFRLLGEVMGDVEFPQFSGAQVCARRLIGRAQERGNHAPLRRLEVAEGFARWTDAGFDVLNDEPVVAVVGQALCFVIPPGRGLVWLVVKERMPVAGVQGLSVKTPRREQAQAGEKHGDRRSHAEPPSRTRGREG
jgi:hypothetical protein